MFTKQEQIRPLKDLTQSSLKFVGLYFMLYHEEDFLTHCRIEEAINGISDESYFIRISQTLRVMLFHRRWQIFLPKWFNLRFSFLLDVYFLRKKFFH